MGKSFVYNTGSSNDDKKKSDIRLEVGVFIDGTLNNKDNTDLRTKYGKDGNKGEKGLTAEEKEERKKYIAASHRGVLDKMGTDSSFSNDYTNVARKWKCCTEEYRIYVPGMGTSDVETQGIDRDDDDGFQYGAGSHSGIRARVRLGCERLAEKIKIKIDETSNDIKNIEITVDVFGFSRGAAAARNFVYEITKGEYEPGDIEISYYEDQVVPESHTFTKTERLIITPKHTIKVKKKKKVKQADADGLKTDLKYYNDGKLPRMGHLGYSLLKLDIKPDQLEQIELKVRFLGIYDTVSSYEEWGALGGDSTLKKGLIHIQPNKSLFKDDIKQLNLNTLRCAKIVHFTAKDEHRENFDLTRITGANIKSEQGTYSRIEKNFPGVHCDIGGAYLTGRDFVDEIEVVNKIGIGGIKNPNNIPEVSIELLKDFGKKLISQYWYKNSELKIHEEWGATKYKYHKLTGTRALVYKEYSYIPLHFMKDYCTVYMKDYFIESTFKKYAINDTNLKAAYAHLKPYVMNKGGKEWNFISDEVFVRKQKMDELKKKKAEMERDAKLKKSIIIYDKPATKIDNLRVVKPMINPLEIPVWTEDQKLLRELRNKYFHWSSNRDWLGMDPNDNRKRNEH